MFRQNSIRLREIMSRGDVVQLTSNQLNRVEELIEEIDTFSEPEDVVDEWKEEPAYEEREYLDREERMFYQTENIVGTCEMNIDRFVKGRFLKTLRLLKKGKYRKEPHFPPQIHYFQDKNEGYIGSDGIHRCLAFKAVGIEEIFIRASFYILK